MHDAFLATIAAAPNDPTPRLVYADYLAEADDPRADLIRTEERLRALPATGDEYWAVKATRDRLRVGVDPAWWAAMTYPRTYPIFPGVPKAWRARGRAVRAFVAQWYGVPLADATDWKRHRGGRPPAVEEWHAFARDTAALPFWERDEVPAARSRPGPAARLRNAGGMPLLHDRSHPTQGYLFLVLDSTAGADDPPVQMFAVAGDDRYDVADHGSPPPVRVSRFALMYLARRLTSPGRAVVPLADAGEAVRQLTAGFPASERIDDVWVFEAPDVFAAIEPPAWPTYSATLWAHHRDRLDRDRVPAALRRLLARLPGGTRTGAFGQ